jgi:hypothetical protein
MADPTRVALQGLLDHLGEMQDVMREYLPPNGKLPQKEFIGRIIELLDGPAQRERVAAAKAVLQADEK